jgi:hypothetical protein
VMAMTTMATTMAISMSIVSLPRPQQTLADRSVCIILLTGSDDVSVAGGSKRRK